MSNARAIAAVTQVLRSMIEQYADITVTTKSPDRAATDQGQRVNLFLYHTMPNPAWRNKDIPTRTKPGERGNPPLALNLFYLLSAYGEDGQDLADQRLLGSAMSVLHDLPIIKPSFIKPALRSNLPLANSGIDEQVEKIRIAPDTLNIEEMSRLWTTFQTQYRVSAAYQVAVVLIESQRPTRSALPVAKRGERDRGVNTNVGLDAVLRGFEYRNVDLQPELPSAAVGDTIFLVGNHLPTTDFSVLIRDPKLGNGPSGVVARFDNPESRIPTEKIKIELDANKGQWTSGQLVAEIQQARQSPNGPIDVTSNSVPLSLSPMIKTSDIDDFAIFFLNDSTEKKTVSISLEYPIGPNRNVLLILNRDTVQDTQNENPETGKTVFQIPIEPDELGLSDLTPTFDISNVPPGRYWVRLRVDGVDSRLIERKFNDATGKYEVEFDPKQRIKVE